MTDSKNPKPGGDGDTVVRPGLAKEVEERLAEQQKGGPSANGTAASGGPARPSSDTEQPTQAMPRVTPAPQAAPQNGNPAGPPPVQSRPLFAPEKPASAPRPGAQQSAPVGPPPTPRPTPLADQLQTMAPVASGAASERAGASAKSRKARLRLVKVDPWSVMKTSFLLAVAFGIVTFVAVTMVWSVLGAAGVWDSVNDAVKSVDDTSTFDITQYLGTSRVLGFTAVLAVVDVVLLTALATLTAFLYNLAAALLGGIELTFADDRH